jgi:hypothetical protein
MLNLKLKTSLFELTLSQTTATAQVAAMTPILPRNKTNDPTLFIAMTRSTLLVNILKACKKA